MRKRAAARRAKAKAIVAGGAVRLAAEKQKNNESGACVVCAATAAVARAALDRPRVLAHDRRAADLAGHARDGRDVAHELVVRALGIVTVTPASRILRMPAAWWGGGVATASSTTTTR